MTEHKNIYMALAKAQEKMQPLIRTAENEGFKRGGKASKYADLADVVEAVRGALTQEGIAYFHVPLQDEFGHAMTTILHHGASDTKIEARVPLLLSKQDMQGYKAATTYAKRIGLESVTGIAPDDDDDGETDRQHGMPSMGAAIGDAWRDAVMDSLPPNASARQTAEAFADAICADFQGKGQKALDNRWERHKKMIEQMQSRFPDLADKVIDAYETRKNELTDDKVPA